MASCFPASVIVPDREQRQLWMRMPGDALLQPPYAATLKVKSDAQNRFRYTPQRNKKGYSDSWKIYQLQRGSMRT
jgi:hypothetical protein